MPSEMIINSERKLKPAPESTASGGVAELSLGGLKKLDFPTFKKNNSNRRGKSSSNNLESYCSMNTEGSIATCTAHSGMSTYPDQKCAGEEARECNSKDEISFKEGDVVTTRSGHRIAQDSNLIRRKVAQPPDVPADTPRLISIADSTDELVMSLCNAAFVYSERNET